MTGEDLDLEGRWKEEWNYYINGLSHGGIRLSGQKDSLLWMHNPKNGEVTTNLAYDLIESSTLQPAHNNAILYYPSKDQMFSLACNGEPYFNLGQLEKKRLLWPQSLLFVPG